MKYILQLSYMGTNYHGWQRQPQHPSVQQTLEEAIEKMLRKKINVVGCGRTDTGVHASRYFAHLRLPGMVEFGFDPVKRLNQILPKDIAVHDFRPVNSDFHAQHSAKSRSYTYLMHFSKSPFLCLQSAFYGHSELDVEQMRKATALLTGYSDFKSMCKQPQLYKHTKCELTVSSLTFLDQGKRLRFEFTANRFLRNMVRLLVGNVIEVGRGNLSLEKFEYHLRSGKRPAHFNLARPEGLYLSDVLYDGLHFRL